MRLWHKDLIPVLPRQQLLSQWRECCCIARNIAVNKTPNHLLVNKVLEYSTAHFYEYAVLIYKEMISRGYKCDFDRFTMWWGSVHFERLKYEDIFYGWHNRRYLQQCYYNMQEKFDCGGITDEEFDKIELTCWKLKH